MIIILGVLLLLLLCAVAKVFPGDLLPATYLSNNTVKARTELERRGSYMATLEGALGREHGLVVLIKECLGNDPGRRPTASQALGRVRDMVAGHRLPYSHMNRFVTYRYTSGKIISIK